MRNDQDLLLFTTSFPTGTGEVFLEKEVRFLAERFRRIFVFPNQKQEGKRPLPPNVRMVDLDEMPHSSSIPGRPSIAFLKRIFSDGVLRAPRYHFSALRMAARRAGALVKWMDREELQDPVLYSYWFAAWGNVLALLKREKLIQHFISRGHSGELYKDRPRQVPFWSLRAGKVDRLFTVSQYAKTYLEKERGFPEDRLEVARLGVEDQGEGPVPGQAENRFRLLSCSTMVGEKRLDLLMETLKKLSFKVEWWHIGSGKYWDHLIKKKEELPSHVTVSFLGQLENRSIMDLYGKHPVDLFVNVSSTEGIPVAIMEAISFGIPVMGTDVGGMREVVGTETGKLLPSSPSSALIAEEIGRARSEGWTRDQEFRGKVKAFFLENYYAGTNYPAFIERIRAYGNG